MFVFFLQMHFHQKSTNQLSNGIKALMLLLITYTTWCDGALTSEEINDAINLATPEKYCGKKLTDAMKVYCIPAIRNAIMKSDYSRTVEKKSCEYHMPT